MKKLLVVLVVLVGLGSTANAQSKIGHVNSQALLDTMPSRKTAITKLQEFEKNGFEELQEMEKDYRQAVQIYQENAGTYSPVIRQIEEEKIMKKEKALTDRQQELQVEMQAYQQELNDPILAKVQEAVKIVSERMKLAYVIDESVTLYFGGGTDITDEVAAELLKLDAQ